MKRFVCCSQLTNILFLTQSNGFTYQGIIFHEEHEFDQNQATKDAKTLGNFQSIEYRLKLKLQNAITN